jgi:hypothetical protein
MQQGRLWCSFDVPPTDREQWDRPGGLCNRRHVTRLQSGGRSCGPNKLSMRLLGHKAMRPEYEEGALFTGA